MLQRHADKGEEDWEIYAECVRDILCKHSGLKKSDQPIKEKLTYEKVLNNETR